MMLLLSGEGPTDLGSCTMGLPSCENDEHGSFELGVLTVMLDRLLEPHLQYLLSDIPNSIRYIPEQELARVAKALSGGRSIHLRGSRTPAETGFYFIPARTLSELAKVLEVEHGDHVIAVLFRDSDGTNITAHQDWQIKFKSMQDGFKHSGFTKGVPMLPKPKSESWLICASKDQPYQNCSVLEALPGNDRAPNSAKQRLQECFGAVEVTRHSLVEWIKDHDLKPALLAEEMPSFDAFLKSLKNALILTRQPFQATTN